MVELFQKLFNENHVSEREVESNELVHGRNYRYCQRIRLREGKIAVKK